MQPTLAQVEGWARHAGEILRQHFRGSLKVRHKSLIDLVTEADGLSEDYILGQIRAAFPGDTVFSEEIGQVAGSSQRVWYVDPLDGTVNYAHGIPLYTVSIACAEAGQLRLGVIYDPSHDECFSAEAGKGAWLNGTQRLQVTNPPDLDHSLLITGFPYHIRQRPGRIFPLFEYFAMHSQGVRRLGSAAMDLCYVAAGRFDGYWELSIMPHDVAAGALIAAEAGATVTTAEGGPLPLTPPLSILAAPPHIHQQMLAGLHSVPDVK